MHKAKDIVVLVDLLGNNQKLHMLYDNMNSRA